MAVEDGTPHSRNHLRNRLDEIDRQLADATSAIAKGPISHVERGSPLNGDLERLRAEREQVLIEMNALPRSEGG